MDSIYRFNGKNIDGIYCFIDETELDGDNKKFVILYNKISPFYYIGQKMFSKIKFGGEFNFRNDFLQYIVINENDTVLETSVGTAENFYFLIKKAK